MNFFSGMWNAIATALGSKRGTIAILSMSALALFGWALYIFKGEKVSCLGLKSEIVAIRAEKDYYKDLNQILVKGLLDIKEKAKEFREDVDSIADQQPGASLMQLNRMFVSDTTTPKAKYVYKVADSVIAKYRRDSIRLKKKHSFLTQ